VASLIIVLQASIRENSVYCSLWRKRI